MDPSLFEGAAVPIYLFPAILLLPSLSALPPDVTEPPHLCRDFATCPILGTSALVVDVDDVMSDPTAPKVADVTFKFPVDESVVKPFVPLFASPSSVKSATLTTCEYELLLPAVQ